MLRLLIVSVLANGHPPSATAQELLERTLALVGGQAITLSDARAAIALGLIEIPKGLEPVAAATARLVDRELVLREVQRYAPPAPTDNEIDARLDELRRRVSGPAALTKILHEHGFTESRLRAWLRDDVRTQVYLSQRFASATAPSDTEVSAAYMRQRSEFDQAGMPFEQAAAIVRDRLVAARRAELLADWLAELRRRTDVVILVQ